MKDNGRKTALGKVPAYNDVDNLWVLLVKVSLKWLIGMWKAFLIDNEDGYDKEEKN